MTKKASSGRDAFRFSRRGIRATAAFGVGAAIADDHINMAIRERMEAKTATQRKPLTRVFEDWLVRLGVPG